MARGITGTRFSSSIRIWTQHFYSDSFGEADTRSSGGRGHICRFFSVVAYIEARMELHAAAASRVDGIF